MPEPMRTRLTRKDMEETVRRGESVMYDGQIITKVEELPDDAVLASGDADREAEVRTAIDAQIMTLMAQRNRLGTAGPGAAQSSQRGVGGPAAIPPAGDPGSAENAARAGTAGPSDPPAESRAPAPAVAGQPAAPRAAESQGEARGRKP